MSRPDPWEARHAGDMQELCKQWYSKHIVVLTFEGRVPEDGNPGPLRQITTTGIVVRRFGDQCWILTSRLTLLGRMPDPTSGTVTNLEGSQTGTFSVQGLEGGDTDRLWELCTTNDFPWGDRTPLTIEAPGPHGNQIYLLGLQDDPQNKLRATMGKFSDGFFGNTDAAVIESKYTPTYFDYVPHVFYAREQLEIKRWNFGDSRRHLVESSASGDFFLAPGAATDDVAVPPPIGYGTTCVDLSNGDLIGIVISNCVNVSRSVLMLSSANFKAVVDQLE